ncbi:hypothetical protein [Flavobacterium sp.]|jgi:hypothetical protein|uniref:hypothetical protein n=1 Tax=Flavobacterium sp. TaxID=239 RepID=UPI0037C04472
MTNPFYNKGFDVLQGSSNRSDALEGEFQAVEQGFEAVNARFAGIDPYNTELVAARQGQASLLLNLQRYLSTLAPATANLSMGGFRVENAGPAVAGSDLVTFTQLIAATTPGNPPAASSETFGLSLTNREGTASYSLSTPDALALMGMGVI